LNDPFTALTIAIVPPINSFGRYLAVRLRWFEDRVDKWIRFGSGRIGHESNNFSHACAENRQYCPDLS
jgi:hypothetical protein